MINTAKCKVLLRILAVMTVLMMVLALASCDVIAPILDNLGIDVGGMLGDKNEGENDGDDQGKPGDNNQEKPGDDNQEKPGDDNQEKPGDDNQEKPGDDNQGNTGDNNDDNTGDNPGDDNGDNSDNQDPPQCEHEWGEGVIVLTPTCGTDEKGIISSTCIKCTETVETEFDAKDEHKLERTVITEMECGVDGLEMDKCEYCDYLVQYVIPSVSHSFVFKEVPDEAGRYGYVCTNCGTVDKYVEVVRYEDFGAVGNGITDDSAAIRAAHEYANKHGIMVMGRADAIYYIGILDKTITIMTDTDWNGATFIFDDSNIMWDDAKHRQVNVFTIQPETAIQALSVPEGMTVSKGQTNIGMTFDEPCMIRIENSEERIYIRFGENKNSGSRKTELLLVDENGNVDPSTPIQYDYSGITAIYRFSTDETPISVGNARIITRVPDPRDQDPSYENNYCFFYRGVAVRRSNVTLYGIEHSIQGEMMTIEVDRNGDGSIDKWGDDKSYGVPYTGFFNFESCYNVTMRDTLVQGHQAYSFYQLNEDTGAITRNEMGSYDIYANYCLNLSFINITQYENEATGEVITNRFMYHGIMGTNFCRNLVMDNCYVDRFDAHQAMYNATLTNSTFGFGILVIGDGTLYIENVYRIAQGPFIALRTDYNSIFLGDVVIKNSRMGPDVSSIIGGNWRSFYNGIPNWMCSSITIDGLVVPRNSLNIYNVTSANPHTLTDKVNPLYLPKFISVNGVVTEGGSDVTVYASAYTDAFALVELNPDPYDLWLDEHNLDEGVIVIEPSATDCTPGLIRYTCIDCGVIAERVIFSKIPHASLEHTITDGVITYNCTACNHAFTPEKGYCMDGTDHNAMMGVGNSTNFTTVANNNQNPLINENGEYELLKKTSKSTTKLQLWIPSTDPDFKVMTSANNATGFLSFKINAYTDKDLFMKFVDSKSNISTDRWTEKGCIVDAFFAVSAPDSDGVVTVTGWDGIVLKSVTTSKGNEFTGWFDVKIVIELSSEDDSVTLHYYVGGQYVDTASRELTTSNDLIDSVYIEGNTKVKNSGIMLDDIAFGCNYKKCSPVEE